MIGCSLAPLNFPELLNRLLRWSRLWREI